MTWMRLLAADRAFTVPVMNPDDRIALVVIFFLIVLPGLMFELGARYQRRKMLAAIRSEHATRVAAWRGDQLPPVPAIDPNDPGSMVERYGQLVYNSARMSFDGPGAPDQAEHRRQMHQMYTEAQRLEDLIRLRLSESNDSRRAPVRPTGEPQEL